uniref:Nuclear pore glycoprotein p62 n=1 Tax=Schistocephalus solidus TaxID=70667 RepID=A0A0X3PSR5_SCHSO
MSGFTFGTATSKPAFSFGSLGAAQTTSASATPASVTTANTKPNFSFGLPTASPATTAVAPAAGASPATTSFQLGGFGTIAATSATAPQPSFGFSLSKPLSSPAATTASTTSAPSGFSFNLGKSAASTQAATGSTTPASSGITFGAPSSLTFGTPQAASVTAVGTTATATVAPTTQTSQLMGGTQGSPFALGTTNTTTNTGSPFSLSLSKPTTALPTTTMATTSATPFASLVTSTTGGTSMPGFSFGGLSSMSSTPGSTSTATTTTTATSTTAVASTVQPTLTYRQLEDMVNKWTYELDEQERDFATELNRLNKADRILVENAEKISSLQSTVEACKSGQSRIEQELEFVESQQRELEGLLEPLEQAATDLPPSQQHADAEREAIFQMCVNTDLELGQLLTDLREMADRVNSITSDISEPKIAHDRTASDLASNSTLGSTNVIGQVTRILNSHMHSLSWLNQNTQELMEKLKFLTAS